MPSYLLKVWCNNEYADNAPGAVLVNIHPAWATLQLKHREAFIALASEDRKDGYDHLQEIRYWDYSPQPFDIYDQAWTKDWDGQDSDGLFDTCGESFLTVDTHEVYALEHLMYDEYRQVQCPVDLPEGVIHGLDTSRLVIRGDGLLWVFRSKRSEGGCTTATLLWSEIEAIAESTARV